MRNNGFTLAEVLITLVIIGVVAAITIPAMQNSTQKQELVTGLKKAYSTLSNSLYKITENNGYPQGDYTYLNDVNFIDEFEKVTSFVKKCEETNECFGQGSKNYKNVYKNLSGKNATFYSGKAIILEDGQMFSHVNDVGAFVYGLSAEDKENVVGRVVVDVNGAKKPNKMGYDLFVFYIVNGKGFIPSGANGETTGAGSCSRSTSQDAGYMCTAKVLTEGVINY